jgi:hypothetical protein
LVLRECAEVGMVPPLVATTVTALEPEVVASPLSSAAVIAEELPRTSPVRVEPVPVPPRATARVPALKSEALALVATVARPVISPVGTETNWFAVPLIVEPTRHAAILSRIASESTRNWLCIYKDLAYSLITPGPTAYKLEPSVLTNACPEHLDAVSPTVIPP